MPPEEDFSQKGFFAQYFSYSRGNPNRKVTRAREKERETKGLFLILKPLKVIYAGLQLCHDCSDRYSEPFFIIISFSHLIHKKMPAYDFKTKSRAVRE